MNPQYFIWGSLMKSFALPTGQVKYTESGKMRHHYRSIYPEMHSKNAADSRHSW